MQKTVATLQFTAVRQGVCRPVATRAELACPPVLTDCRLLVAFVRAVAVLCALISQILQFARLPPCVYVT